MKTAIVTRQGMGTVETIRVAVSEKMQRAVLEVSSSTAKVRNPTVADLQKHFPKCFGYTTYLLPY